ncbi:ATP-binding cassette domain-containing protein [Alkalibaculum sp. M08DMB]|uniref:ATP-binding cassette domain-containing protein n=1 Tax=Alkalibaculum sporogenes TaxID=2655001 RepID=A0A6A7KB78_9FIRM|nr:ABC transporter ATP-binding protein [Alkalibaculum sporogenes]MPW26646.1 ATP-binding cassette domain-containing protein [Alkalibaculum sporogenes]
MLKIDNVSKTYKKGNKEALKNINLDIGKGEFTALLGQNGAGKTTLINILAGNVQKTKGIVTIGGYDLDNNSLETKRIIGIVPQEVGHDYVFTIEEMLKKQSGYFGIKNNKNYIDDLLEELSLKDKRKVTARELSGGMKRRLLIAKALVHKPKILILDEPTAGVDIELRRSMYGFLNKLHGEGTTIILTTHYIEEAEKLCKRIIVIDDGKIIEDQPKEKLMGLFSENTRIKFEFDYDINSSDIEFLEEYSPIIKENRELQIKVNKSDLSKVLRLVSERGLKFVDINVDKPKLEDIYLKLIRH